MLGKYCIIRDHRAGVFAGTLSWVNKANRLNIRLKEARKLWHWSGAASVEQLSVDGVNKPDSCKFTVETIEQEIFDCVQIIKATPKAKKNIRAVKAWRA